jgi:hypothetical protein
MGSGGVRQRTLAAVIVPTLILAGAACTSAPATAPAAPPSSPSPSESLVSPAAAAPPPHTVSDPGKVTGTLAGRHCHARGTPPGQLPDPACTPGAYDPKVTAAVLCNPSYSTRAYRPPAYQTSRFKFEQAYPAYGVPAGARSELDHLISLDLGGSNDAANLWPQVPAPGKPAVPNPKDTAEARLHDWVCAASGAQAEGRLATARRAIAADWLTALEVTGAR